MYVVLVGCRVNCEMFFKARLLENIVVQNLYCQSCATFHLTT